MVKKKVRILSLDGGGIRGIIPATVMQYVESELIRKTGNPDARIADYFDMVVGTSTGAILGCFYLTPNNGGGPSSRFTAKQALEIYSKRGNEIFDLSKKREWFGLRQLFNATRFSPKKLEAIFLETFDDLKLHELCKPCIVTAYNMAKGEAVFFNSHEPKEKQAVRQYYVRDVVRSTSAAPTYFPPAIVKNLATGEKMVNLDGGVFANNPSMCAYAEARTTNFKDLEIETPGAKDILMLSIGTGSLPIDLRNYQNSQKWGVINWAKAAPEIMMDGGLDTVNYQVDKIFSSLAPKYRKNFKRINVPKSLRFPENGQKDFIPPYNADMSDASPKNIQDLQVAGQKALEDANKQKQGEETLDKFIDRLIEIQNEIEQAVI
jgi:patatin-like phospholipase/acyl hydrolase